MKPKTQDRALVAISSGWEVTIMLIASESPRRIELADGTRYEVNRRGEIVRITGGHIYDGALAPAVLIASLDLPAAVALKAKLNEFRPVMVGMGAKLKRNPYADTVEQHLTLALRDLTSHASSMATTRELNAELATREGKRWRAREEVLRLAAASIKGEGHEQEREAQGALPLVRWQVPRRSDDLGAPGRLP